MPEGHAVYAAMGRTVFDTMSALARELGAINLGQGFPEGPEPAALLEAAARALTGRSNQYPPSAGLPELRAGVAGFYARRQGLAVEAEEVIVTSGATEAIACALLALVRPGDEVILFAPAYDAYAPMVRRCGGVPVFVELAAPAFGYDEAAIRAVAGPKTRGIVVNDPLNPMGTAAGAEDLAMLARLCREHDWWAVCDEVWEEVRFDGRGHASLMAQPGMEGRAVKIGSAGKLFGLTGWKIGWMVARGRIGTLMMRAHQFVTYTSAPALQAAVSEGLSLADEWFAAQRDGWAEQRARLVYGLGDAGFAVLPNGATWFVSIDLRASGIGLTDREFAERAVREAGVASIPVSAFHENGGPDNLVRLCFTKPAGQIDEAIGRLAQFRRAISG